MTIMADKSYLLDGRIHRYVVEHSLREPEILRRLREETASHPQAIMQIPPEQGELFGLLVRATGAKKVLEVGVFTGYSSLCIAMALPAEGRLIACDISEEFTQTARRFWKEAGVDGKIDLRIAPAVETLGKLVDEGHADTFDFAFIDADKTSYKQYYEYALRLVRRGGLIALDNMLQQGKVIDPEANDASTVAIRQLNDTIARDERVQASLLPIADGVMLALRR